MVRLFEQKPERILRYILYLQLLLWTAIPAFTYANAPLDVVENIGWGREWQLGYYKHPPLQAWLSYVGWLLGQGHPWPIYLISQICVVLTQLGVFSLVRDIAGARRGLWAVLLFSLVYYANLPTPEFNANVLQMPIWIWSAFAMRRAIEKGGPRWWLTLGVLLALALYAKYSVVVLVAALAIALFTQPAGRRALASPWPFAAAALSATLAAPELLWLASVDYLPLTYTAETNASAGILGRLGGLVDFLAVQALDQLLAIILLLIAGVRPSPAPPGRIVDEHRFVAVLALAPLAVTALASIFSDVSVRDMWGAPMAPFLTVAAAVLLDPGRRLKPAMVTGAALFLALPLCVGIAATFAGYRAKPPKVAYPGPAITQSLDRIWQEETDTPLDIVAGGVWSSGVVAAYSKDRPHVFVEGNWRYNPWITRERVASRGILVVWTGSDDPPPELARLGPFQARGAVKARYRKGGKMADMKWAIRAPGLPAPAGTVKP